MPSDARIADITPRKHDEKADRWGDDSFPASDAPANPNVTGFVATENDGETEKGAGGHTSPEHDSGKTKAEKK